VVGARADATARALAALRLQYPDHADALESRFLRQSGRQLLMSRYRDLLEEGLISGELFHDLEREQSDRSSSGRLPPLDLGLETAQLIGSFEMFAGLDPAELKALARLFRPRLLVPDEAIIKKGERGRAMFFISSGAVEVVSSVAQGCRPIGQPMFVTAARENLIGALDGRPPLEVLQAVFAASPPEDQPLFDGSLFLGVAMREGESSYAQGDYLVRNIAGVTEARSELAVDSAVHEGQVVQFHLRDPRTAEADLGLALARLEQSGAGAARGALLFSCLGRGSALYGAPNRESECFAGTFRDVPLAGFFCNGEIGPVGKRSFLHGYTAAFALFKERV
jgi:hypothetical protein